MSETSFKKYCKENGLTAQKIEDMTGVKKKTVYSYFNGDRSPSRTTRKILRDKLGIDTGKIFD